MSTNIKEVAKEAGVSVATVSHVINQTRYVSDETKLKVLKAMKQLGYRPNLVARSLRSQRSKIVGLIIPVCPSDTSGFFFTTIAQGIENKLKEHGYNLLFSNSNENIECEKEQIRVFNSQLVDGLIIAPTVDDHQYLNEVISGDYPVVFIDRKPVGYKSDCVLVDNFSITYKAINTLIEKGHSRIAFISGHMGLTTSDERYFAYKKALEDNNITVDESLIVIAEYGKTSFESGYEFTKKLFTSQKFSAIFVANNLMSMGALAFLNEQRVKIPEELAVIGFDDYDWTKISVPPLSVIKQPAFDMGRKAAEVLIDRINNPTKRFKEYRMSAEFIIRGSI